MAVADREPAENSFATVANVDDPVSTPCIGVCKLDRASGLCRGCLRSGEEIAIWRDASHEQRIRILERIRQRKEEGYLPRADPPQ